jgi:prepilin-type N-terminal cleavage/methylation domain-containing protein
MNRGVLKKMSSGFSLIELMTSVVIIGILSGVSINAYQRYKASARSVEMYNYVLNIERTQQMYHLDYGTFLFLKNSTSTTAQAAMQAGTDWVADGGESIQMQNNWAQVGRYVTTIGTRTRFNVVTNMGKFQRNGTAAGWSTTWNRGPITQPLYRAYDEFDVRINASGQNYVCANSSGVVISYYPTDFGAIPNPGRAYDWSLTGAVAKLGSRDGDCYQISRLLTFDSRSGEYKRSGFIHFH